MPVEVYVSDLYAAEHSVLTWSRIPLLPHTARRWNGLFLLTVAACKASFMLEVIEFIKRNTAEERRNIPVDYLPRIIRKFTRKHVCYLPTSLSVNHENII